MVILVSIVVAILVDNDWDNDHDNDYDNDYDNDCAAGGRQDACREERGGCRARAGRAATTRGPTRERGGGVPGDA